MDSSKTPFNAYPQRPRGRRRPPKDTPPKTQRRQPNYLSTPFEEWAQVVEELDALPRDLPKKAQDFIISLREDPPQHLSEAQVAWLEDLQKDYL